LNPYEETLTTTSK